MNTQPITELLFSAAEVSREAGVAEHELRHFEPGDFGSPGHWRMKGNGVIYTASGVERLADGFETLGRLVAAHTLRTFLKQRQERRTQLPVPPGNRHRGGSPWFRAGQME